MSVASRIIPCLDVDKGRVVKGTNFVDIVMLAILSKLQKNMIKMVLMS